MDLDDLASSSPGSSSMEAIGRTKSENSMNISLKGHCRRGSSGYMATESSNIGKDSLRSLSRSKMPSTVFECFTAVFLHQQSSLPSGGALLG